MPLFAFFGLWTTTLLAGAAAVSVPVIIHLLNRRRFKIVTWAAMRFLLNAQRQNTRRMRIEQILLLLTRMAMVAAIVVAMAAVMPWAEPLWAYVVPARWITTAQHYEQRVHHIFVIDASMSMNLHDGSKTVFDRARALALQKIDASQQSDGFSVLIVKDSPTWLIGEASQDRARVRRELEALRCGHGNASVPVALNMVAAKLIEASQRFPAQFVYFITDLQRSTWQSAAAVSEQGDDARDRTLREIKDRAGVVFVDVGRNDVTNLAITDLSFANPFVTTGNPVLVNATVRNFGVEPKKVHVELLVGKARENSHEPPLAMHLVDEQASEEPLRPNDQRSIKLTYRFPIAGTYVVQARLQSADPLEVDDARAVVVTVKNTIPVLVVNGKVTPDFFDTATGYLRLVLNPYPSGTEPKELALRPRVITQRQFADLSDDDLKEYDCIYWCDVGQFGSADLRRMETHVRLGGGMVFSMGDKAIENLDAYNRLLYRDEHGLLPAKLLKKISAPAEQYFYLKAADEEKSFLELPLSEFKDDRSKTTLNHVHFYQYVQAAPAPQARQILKFQPEEAANAKEVKGEPIPIGDPAMLEWNPPMSRAPGEMVQGKDGKRAGAPAHYRGKVVLLTSTVNTDWTNLPGSPSYIALMQELTRLAVSGRLREQAGVVGAVLEDYLPGGGAELDVTMHYPEAVSDVKPVKSRTQLIEDVNVFHFGDTDYSGIYRVIVNTTGQEIPFAVNVPIASIDQHGSESDLARLNEEALRKNYPDWKLQIVTDPRHVDIKLGPAPVTVSLEQTPVGPTIARYILLAVFGLLFIEVIMAWRFGHYTSVEGVTAPATASMVWPLSLAITALVIFGISAFVMWRIVQTDDVMGVFPEFMRDFVRAGFERLLGKAPPPPGESSRWRPLFDGWVPETILGIGGSQHWWAIILFLFGGTMVLLTYLAEAPAVARPYKLILAGLRLCMLAMTIWLLLPQAAITFTNDVWPNVVILLDTSRSMGEPDVFQDAGVMTRSKKLSDLIRKQAEEGLPEKIRQLRVELEAAAKKKQADPADTAAGKEVDYLESKIRYWEKQQEIINSPKWRPTRLQLAQALFAQPDNDWLSRLHLDRKMKVHIYQLDVNGRAVKLTDAKGPAGEIVDPHVPAQIERSKEALARLEADGKESRLGTALQQVIDQYRGSSLAGVIMITDGVTTRDRTIGETATEYAAQKGVPLFLIGIGDDHEIRDLKLHDLQCEDTVFKGDRVNFQCRLTGKGYTDLTVPVVLKVKGKDGKEKEVDRLKVKVDPRGKSVMVRLKHTPNEVGRKTYIIEVEQPKIEGNEKPMPPGNLRLERAIDVVEDKEIRVLFVEQQPRYEFRYVKFLLERETPNQKSRKKSITLNVVLLDSDDGFAEQDKAALPDFPATLDELNKYDVVVFGDCDPNHRKLGMQRLKNLANFVRGEDDKGRKLPKAGGGFLMIAGTSFSPHAYKNTPLADILPIEPLADRPPREPERARTDRLRPELTPSGRVHPIFKFSNDDAENAQIWQRLAPMYWSSSHYRAKPLAEVLAVHPSQKAEGPVRPNQDTRLPLVVQQYVGSGRSMFVGFDETWRWRLREDEAKFNHYWVQVMRYLSRGRSNRTDLRLSQQTPYRLGEEIKVIVRFPDGATGPDGMRITDKTDVKVVVEYRPQADEKDAAKDVEYQAMTLKKVEGSWGTYDGSLNRTREGKYRFRLTTPDVRKYQPDGEAPSADAIVELPPGELDRLRMNADEMLKAADTTQGRFYTLATADRVVDEVPPGVRVSFTSPQPPLRVWNHALVFCMVMLLLTAEWFLRKRKHLL